MGIKNCSFTKRRNRVRTKIKKVAGRNRMSVFRSGRHIYAQIIDDAASTTLVAASTLDKSIRQLNKSNCNIESAIKVGQLLAERAVAKEISSVVFDRGGYKYHGAIEALANEARKKLQF